MNETEFGSCYYCEQNATMHFGDIRLCDDCYIARSSCCQEFADNDLTLETSECTIREES